MEKYEYKKPEEIKPWGKQGFCTHPQHNPPMHMVIPLEGFDHTCPGCGRSIHVETNRAIL